MSLFVELIRGWKSLEEALVDQKFINWQMPNIDNMLEGEIRTRNVHDGSVNIELKLELIQGEIIPILSITGTSKSSMDRVKTTVVHERMQALSNVLRHVYTKSMGEELNLDVEFDKETEAWYNNWKRKSKHYRNRKQRELELEKDTM